MSLKPLILAAAAALISSCAASSNWHLMDEGYSIDVPDPDKIVFEVHVNQLKQLGGDVNGARFRSFVAERLKWHDLCPSGWTADACVADGSCIQRTRRSVTVTGRCALP